MSKFNKNTKKKDVTVNNAGGEAYKLNPEMELYSLVSTSMVSDSYYESNSERLNRMRSLMNKVSPEFVAKLAVYAREQMNLRSIPLVLAVELAKIHSGDNLVSRMVTRVVNRADELSELLAAYQNLNEREGTKKLHKLSNQIKIGLANCFYKFDEYQFAKYNRKNEVKLRDVLFLTHPKPRTLEEAQLFKKIANDELETPDTWEVNISKVGQTAKDETDLNNSKKAEWERLIIEQKLPYMAMLRNLKNIVKSNVSEEVMDKVISYLTNVKAIENSKQLPFRYLSAYREFSNIDNKSDVSSSVYVNSILKALNNAVIKASHNLPFNDSDNILIAADVSGSMQAPISPNSSVQRYDIGLLMAMTLQYKCKKVVSGFFGDTWKVVNLPNSNILQNVNELHRREGEVGYSTNGFKVIQWALDNKLSFDKIMMFTDCELYNDGYYENTVRQYWEKYKKFNPNAKLYLFDLAGYGTTPIKINENDSFIISGFSDKIWNILNAIEGGESALSEIHNIKL